MSRYREPPKDAVEQIAAVANQVSKSARAPQLVNSTVAVDQILDIKGMIRVHGAGGEIVVESGQSNASFLGGSAGFALYRSNNDPNSFFANYGSAALVLWRGEPNTLWIQDRLSNIVLADDRHGALLGRPHIPWFAMPQANFSSPPVTTTSASYAAQWTIHAEVCNPKVSVWVFVKCSDGSTGGNIRLVDSDAASSVLDTQSIPVGTNNYIHLNGTISGLPDLMFMGMFGRMDVQVQRTAGAGSIGTQVTHVVGWGEPW